MICGEQVWAKTPLWSSAVPELGSQASPRFAPGLCRRQPRPESLFPQATHEIPIQARDPDHRSTPAAGTGMRPEPRCRNYLQIGK